MVQCSTNNFAAYRKIMGGTSLFRVGDDVELWRVLLHLSVLVVCLLMFEHVLHHLERRAAVSTKYQQLLSKIYRELMILGLIGLCLKVLKEVPSIDGSSPAMTAFQVADLTIFILALALILQAVCIFLVLQKHYVQADRAELLSTESLADDLIKTTSSPTQETEKLIHLRLLRHFFLKRFNLPQLFPFAKYLRQAQNNQITIMTNVGALMWTLLLCIAWVLEGITTALYYGEPAHTRRRGLVIVLIWFSFALLGLHGIVFAYFRSCVYQLLNAAGMSKNQATLATHLRSIASEECHAWTQEEAGRALLTLQKVQEKRELSLRKNCGSYEKKNKATFETVAGVKTSWFSQKLWRFTVMMLLMLNGFYLALVVQCVAYQLGLVSTGLGVLEVLAIPVSLALNTFFFQPQIFRNFVLVCSIYNVDGITLSEVINHFREIVELRSEFASLLRKTMQEKKVALSDLQVELERRDPSQTGAVDVEKMRAVLRVCGLRLSSNRFSSVARLLFKMKETKIEYAQLLKLLAIAQSDELEDSVCTDRKITLYHHPLLLQSVMSEEDEKEATENSYLPPTASSNNSDMEYLSNRQKLKRNSSKFHGASSKALCDLFHLDTTKDIALAVITQDKYLATV